MVSLWKILKWLSNVLFGSIMLGIIIGVIGNYFYASLNHKEFTTLIYFVGIFNLYWKYLITSFAATIIFLILVWNKDRADYFGNFWEVYKPSDKILPDDFRIQKYKHAYLSRNSDKILGNSLAKDKNILIIGKPKIGKTRTAYEAISKIKNFVVIKPKPIDYDLKEIKFPPFINKHVILFLDDLQRFADKNVEGTIDIFKRESEQLIIIATCRTGEELDFVKENILSLHREFDVLELEEINYGEAVKLIDEIKKENSDFKFNEQFDGTPGSITLDLDDIKARYRNSGDGKVIIKAIKLLRAGNSYIYDESIIKEICRHIFEVSDEKLRRHSWDETITRLVENNIITIYNDIIDIYSSYLDCCVNDYDPQKEDLLKLLDIFTKHKDTRRIIYLGDGFAKKRDYTQARDCFREALAINLQLASAHSHLGYALTKLGELEEAHADYRYAKSLYKQAINEFEAAIKLSPHYPVNHNNFGFVLTRLGEISEENIASRELFERARKEHVEAIRLKPDYPSAYRSLAYVLGNLERYEEAEDKYREAIKLDSESAFTHNLLGHLLANELGRFDEAENEYREAIRLKPDYPSAHVNLGYLLSKTERNEEAEIEYRAAIKILPDHVVAYVNLGYALNGLGKFTEASIEVRKALEINPKYAEAHCALGYALTNLERFDEAKNEYEEAIRLNSDLSEAHTNLGYLLALMGRSQSIKENEIEAKLLYEKAEKEYRNTLAIVPNDENALNGLGIVLEKLNRDKEAEDCYERLIQINPNNRKAINTYIFFLSSRERLKDLIKLTKDNLITDRKVASRIHAKYARHLIESGKFDEAGSEIIEARNLNPKEAISYKNLGILKEKQGDKAQNGVDRLKLYREAEEAYKVWKELMPKSPSAYRHLANLFAKFGNMNKEAEHEYLSANIIADHYAKNRRDFGIFLFNIGKKDEAIVELELAKDLFEREYKQDEAKKIQLILEHIRM